MTLWYEDAIPLKPMLTAPILTPPLAHSSLKSPLEEFRRGGVSGLTIHCTAVSSKAFPTRGLRPKGVENQDAGG